MKLPLLLPSTHTTSLTLLPHFIISTSNSPHNSRVFLKPRNFSPLSSFTRRKSSTLVSLNSSNELNDSNSITEEIQTQRYDSDNRAEFVEIKNPNFPPFISSWRSKFSFSDQAFFLLTFIACTVIINFFRILSY